VIRARDGRQPDVGPEVLGVRHDGSAGDGLLAPRLLSARPEELAVLRAPVREQLPVPVAGGVSDGPPSLRPAGAPALPAGPPPLGPFPSVRAAARPISAADRPAQKERKKRGRGVRGIAWPVATRDDPEAEAIRGYGRAVRNAGTADGRPPLDAPRLKWPARGPPSAARRGQGEEKRGGHANANDGSNGWTGG
jgi:hypothetical protein